jgi:hypothetical protein
MLERDSLPFLPELAGAPASLRAQGGSTGPRSSTTGSSSMPLPDMASVMKARRGVPQFSQPHVLQGRGLDELEGLFPGFT